MVFLLGKFMGKVFFGQLRAAEMEVSDGEGGGWGKSLNSALGTGGSVAGGGTDAAGGGVKTHWDVQLLRGF